MAITCESSSLILKMILHWMNFMDISKERISECSEDQIQAQSNHNFMVMANKVIRKVILFFTPYPLFQWYPQSKEILLNLSMKCWNSAFNAQGSK
jgi:hypothetical protein